MVHFYMGTKGPETVSRFSLRLTLSCTSPVLFVSLLMCGLGAFLFIQDLSPMFPQPKVEVLSEEEGEEEDEEEDILSLAEEKYRPAALEKMIALIALLVEQSRSER